jgi:glycosyltransferase involved in cell wall biosynthesis
LRIAINTRFLLPGRLEGLGWYTHEMVSRLVRNHPEHEYLFLFDRAFDPAFVYSDRVTPQVLFPPARHPLLFYAWFEHAVPRALKQWGADVFFSPDNFLSLSTKVPTLLTIHDLVPLQMPEQVKWIHRIYYQRYQRRYAERADHLLTISEHIKQTIMELCGVPAPRISVAYNGCREAFLPVDAPTQAAVRARFSDGQPYFFYTGAIHPRKNIPRLIRAYAAFRQRTGARVLLLLGGRMAWHTGEVTDAIANSPYQTDIRVLGYVPDQDLPLLMGAAHALAYPSLSEGFGLPVLEAMRCHVPVLTSNVTALPEVAGDAALLVNPTDEQAIAQGLVDLWENDTLRRRLVEKGQAQQAKFQWDTAAETLHTCLANLDI